MLFIVLQFYNFAVLFYVINILILGRNRLKHDFKVRSKKPNLQFDQLKIN